MSLTNAQSAQAGASQTKSEGSSKGNGVVYSVILDENHPYLKNNDNAKDKEASFIGAILFRYSGQISKDEASLPIAYPFDKNFKTLPVRNESVEIIVGKGGQIYYRRI